MIKNLSVLRSSVDLLQEELFGAKLGASRQISWLLRTENPSTCSLYLAMFCVFGLYEESKELIELLKLFDGEFVVAKQ